MDKEQLYSLVTRGSVFELEALLMTGRLDVNTSLPSGDSMIAVVAGMGDARLETTKILVKHGADINTPIGGMTLLKWIKQPTFCDNEETIAYLTSMGALEKDIDSDTRSVKEEDATHEDEVPELLVIYRETKPELGGLRPVILDQAQHLLQLRLDMLLKDHENQLYLNPVKEFISGFDDSCGSAVIGIVYEKQNGEDVQAFKDWIFKNLFDRELYMLPGTWDLKYRGETTLYGFERDFRLHKRITLDNLLEPMVPAKENNETENAEVIASADSTSHARFQESFVILIAKGYTSDFKKPEELFYLVQTASENTPPPFETEMIVANGPRIAGDVLIFYFENSFKGIPGKLGGSNFYTEFMQKWLNKIVSVESADYIIENYGPRNYQLEKYWPGINILMNKRLSVSNQNLIIKTTNEEQTNQQTEYESVETPAETENESSRKELSVDTTQEISGYPLAFRLNSLELKQTYKYGSDTSESELKASPDYQFLVAGITIQNKTAYFMRFSSEQFSVLNKSGKKINASLYGAGNTVAKSGKILSAETKVTGPDEKLIVSFKGRLTEDVTFLEWELSPEKKYEDDLVYLVPAGESDLNIQFTYNNEPVKYTGESPLKITFNSQGIQQSYQYTSGSSQMETTASSDYRFLVAKVNMTNNAGFAIRFSSENFSVLNNSGNKIDATFYGADDQIAQNGKITSFEKNIDNPDNKQKVKIIGRLSPSVSFIEWELGPHYSREESLVYLIPANAGNVKLHFEYCLADGKHYKNTSSGNSGCFIATAAYGTPMAQEVITLYNFRDMVLIKSEAGRQFVSFYYWFSPAISRFIKRYSLFKRISRLLLKPIILFAKIQLKFREVKK